MKDVSVNEGRTVLFVSHNMVAVEALCKEVIVIERGQMAFQGLTEKAITKYFERSDNSMFIHTQTGELDFVNYEGLKIFDPNQSLHFRFKFKANSQVNSLYVDLAILNEADDFIIHIKSDTIAKPININSENFSVEFNIEPCYLTPGDYKFVLYAYNEKKVFFWAENIVGFKISSKSTFGNKLFIENNRGVLLPITTISYA
jgi:lipopolysaccharide transport system ATP-binding protein